MIAAAAVALSLANPAAALTITSIDGDWQNASPSVSGAGTSSIRWGKSAGYGKSGYDFNATPTSFDVNTDTGFVLGDFTHLNFPITGTVLQSVELAVTFTIQGVAPAITSVFNFSHLETPNYLSKNWVPQTATCANGGANGSGVNVNGCADRVVATNNVATSQTFTIGATTYVLEITGFLKDGKLLTDFWTVERQTNTAQLWAIFRAVDTQEPPAVPLPASGLLLLGGIAALFARRRMA
jgi:hypothetical protein